MKAVRRVPLWFVAILAALICFCFAPIRADAAINQQINFQGKLTNPDGTNVANSSYSIRFRIYDDPSADSANSCAANSCKWEETKSLTVTDGIFQTALGDTTPLPGSVDFNSTPLYLGLKVSTDLEMTPRVQFTATPYAFNSDKLNGLASSAFGQLSQIQTWTGTQTLQPTTNITSAIIKQTSFGSPTADIFNLQTANGTNVIQVSGPAANEAAVTINSVGATRALTLDSASGTLVLGSNTTTMQKSGTAFTFDVNNAASSTLTITNAGAGVASLNVEGGVNIGTGQTYKVNNTQISSANLSNDANLAKLDGNQTFTDANTFQNTVDSTSALVVNNAAGDTILGIDTTNKLVSIGGNLVINTTDNSIVRTTNADFALGTIGSDVTNSTTPTGQLELSDGTVPNSGTGTITTGSQPAVDAAIGAGASAITRADGKYLVIKGGSTLNTSLYDSIAGTFTNSQTLVVGAGTVGAGSLVLPRPGGMYVVLLGNGVVNTSNVDPTGTVTSTAGPSLTAVAGAGTVAFRRPDGKYVIALGTRAGTTNIFDPVANTIVAGPTNSGGVTWSTGSLVLPRPDGSALFVTGGATSTTQVYNPTTANPSIGAFSGVGPSLDGVQATGTCGINNAGSVALRRQDGKYVILSKASVSTVYDPVANTFTCRSSNGPAAALGDGAHAIPLQNGSFLIIRGGNQTNSYIYDPSADTFTTHGTNLTAITTGAFSLMRANGTWQILTGTNSCTTGCTNNYDTGLPMNGSTTKYTSDDISTTALNSSSTLKWTAQFESPYVGTNASTNTAFSTTQIFVRTATNSSGCTTPLNSATDREILSSGDFIRPNSAEDCIRITVQFNRPIPKKIADERGTWTGNGSTVTRLDYATPTLFDLAVDNSTVLHKDNFNFTQPTSQAYDNGTIPTAPTSNAPGSTGSCTTGNHFWFVSFVTNGAESLLSPASTVQSCNGTNQEGLTAIPTGPTGTTARKIYRTRAAALVTDTPFLVGTISDNSTTTYNDGLADGSLGAAFAGAETSGPVATRVEAINGQLTLPNGRITPTTVAGTTQYYLGNVTAAHPSLNQAQTITGTIVIARPNKTFIVIASLSAPAANASIYDPATQTFTAQAGTGIPTAANGPGGFAVKRPDGKYLLILGNGTTTTNIYDPDANIFSAGPALSANAGVGASAIPNTDGTYTIVHGAGATTSTVYNPVNNSMVVGPTLTTAANCGFWAIPLQNGMYKTFVGVASGAVGVTTSMNYNPSTKIFTAGTALTGNHGCGSFAFQRPDGFWLSVTAAGGALGVAQGQTSLINPVDGTSIAGPTFTNVVGQGAHVIPRADGTFLIISAGLTATATSSIYVPYGGTFGVGAGIGTQLAGPTLATNTGVGAVSFQRPDGKWVLINGNTVNTTQLADVGWYADGQYLSEQTQVPALAANSVLNWRQTSDNFVRMEARAASSQAALGTTSFKSVGRPGTSIGNAGGETWVQIEVNFRRDFPTFSGALSGVYVSGGGGVYPFRQISIPSVASYDINNGSDLLTLQNDGLNVFRVSSEGNIYSSSNGGFYSGGADLAENYSSKEDLEPGEVVSIDPTDNHSVKKSTGQYQPDVLGVVSTEPGFVAGAYTETSHPIALVGRVPVKLSTENGPIHEGDYLTSASIPGYAMKATVSGRVLGVALESFEESKAITCPSLGEGNLPSTKCGSVMMFVNLTNYQGASVESVMAQDSEGQTIGDAIIPNVDFPDVNGLVTSKQENILTFLGVLRNRQANGQAPVGSDILTNRVHAVEEIISPVIVADIIRAKTIQATRIEGLEVFTNQISSLAQAYDGLSTQQGQTTSTSTNLGQVQFDTAQFSVSLVSLGTIESRGGLKVDGAAQFNGPATFAALVRFLSNVNLEGDVDASGRVTFNKDSGGVVIIKKGGTRAEVVFNKEYSQLPIVAASLTADQTVLPNGTNEDIKLKEQRLFNSGYTYLVSNLSTKGFTIVLNKRASEDLKFSWSAVSIKDPGTVTGQPDPEEIQ